MKHLFSIAILLLFHSSIWSQSNPQLVDVPAEVFIQSPNTDLNAVLLSPDSLKENVRLLHDHNELMHDFNMQTHSFDEYWKVFSKQWFVLQFQEKGTSYLLFSGRKHIDDDREFVELFNLTKKEYERNVFSIVGKPIAYKKQPFTGETIFYIHQYPCCQSASHNIVRLREIDGEFDILKRFFVGRDGGDMVGPFFPDSSHYNNEFYQLKEKTVLRWSPDVVEENAFENRAPSNIIIHYEKGAVYQKIGEQNGWDFVVFYNGISEEQSMVINYTNFLQRPVYGWIKP